MTNVNHLTTMKQKKTISILRTIIWTMILLQIIYQNNDSSLRKNFGVQGFTPPSSSSSSPSSSALSTSSSMTRKNPFSLTVLLAGKGFGSTDDKSSSNSSTGKKKSSSSSSSSTNDDGPEPANYEYREMSLLFRAMRSQNVKSAQLTQDKRQELEGYVRRIVQRPPTVTGGKSIPLYKIIDYLPGTSWELAFSSSSSTSIMNGLPKTTNIELDFYENGLLDYNLEFPKTLGIKRLTAKSTYTVDSSPVQPGLVSYTYNDITTDAFGLSNLGMGMFSNMLKGRTGYIGTVYFDQTMWIERGFDSNGIEFFNVYIPAKEGDEDLGPATGTSSLTGQWD